MLVDVVCIGWFLCVGCGYVVDYWYVGYVCVVCIDDGVCIVGWIVVYDDDFVGGWIEYLYV